MSQPGKDSSSASLSRFPSAEVMVACIGSRVRLKAT